MSEFLTDQQIKERIAYEFHERDKKAGYPLNSFYDWTRARRVWEYYTTKEEDDDPYYKKGREEYPEFKHYFEGRI